MIQPISDREKEFTLSYHSIIKELQEKAAGEIIVYTKITLSYALLHNLCFTNLVFHPKSVSKHKSWIRPELSPEIFKATLEEIIIFELDSPAKKGKLTTEELLLTIEHFRTLGQKRIE